MSDKGWVKLHRKLIGSDLWLKEPFTRGQAWADLFSLANHTDGFIRVRGLKIPVLRGQVGYSEVSLASRWKWSRGKVRRFLNELKMEQQIEQQIYLNNSIISIVNYDQYQDDTEYGTTNGQQTDTNKNDKKNKNIKKEDKYIYGEFLSLTREEYRKLEEKFNSSLPSIIDFFNLKIASMSLKEWRKKHKSDYNTILYWDRIGAIKLKDLEKDKYHGVFT